MNNNYNLLTFVDVLGQNQYLLMPKRRWWQWQQQPIIISMLVARSPSTSLHRWLWYFFRLILRFFSSSKFLPQVNSASSSRIKWTQQCFSIVLTALCMRSPLPNCIFVFHHCFIACISFPFTSTSCCHSALVPALQPPFRRTISIPPVNSHQKLNYFIFTMRERLPQNNIHQRIQPNV